MSAEQNKTVSRRVIEDCFNHGNLALADDIYAADYVNHNAPPGFPKGPEGFKQEATMYRSAFPDIHITIEDQIAEGDKVVTRWSARGTHQGELMGIPPTNKKATVTGIAIDRLASGKIVEHWEVFDQLGLMQQLGVVPVPGG